MMCQVPSGVAPGTVLQLQSPCGQLIHVQVPVGAVPGTVLQVPLTPAIQQPQQQEVKGLHDVQLWKCGQCSTPQKSAPASGCCGCGRVPPAQQAAEDKNIMKIKIRKGMKPGNKIEIKLPDGRKLDACVPDGMVPGDTWKMNIENQQLQMDIQLQMDTEAQKQISRRDSVTIKIPKTWRRGRSLTVDLPDGRRLTVDVPKGKKRGMSMNVEFLKADIQLQMDKEAQKQNSLYLFEAQKQETRNRWINRNRDSVKVWDEESKGFYYVNKKTGEVTWDKPRLMGSEDVDPTESSRAAAEAEAAGRTLIVDENQQNQKKTQSRSPSLNSSSVNLIGQERQQLPLDEGRHQEHTGNEKEIQIQSKSPSLMNTSSVNLIGQEQQQLPLDEGRQQEHTGNEKEIQIHIEHAFNFDDLVNDKDAEIGSVCFSPDAIRSALSNQENAHWNYVIAVLVLLGFLSMVVGFIAEPDKMVNSVSFSLIRSIVILYIAMVISVSFSMRFCFNPCAPFWYCLISGLHASGDRPRHQTRREWMQEEYRQGPKCYFQNCCFLRKYGSQLTRRLLVFGSVAECVIFIYILCTEYGVSGLIILPAVVTLLGSAIAFQPWQSTKARHAWLGFALFALGNAVSIITFLWFRTWTRIPSGGSLIPFTYGTFAVSFLALSIFLGCMRYRTRVQAHNSVHSDKIKYDEIWKTIGKPQLLVEGSNASKLKVPPIKLFDGKIRQFEKEKPMSMFGNPCLILADLLKKAEIANPVFQDLVRKWKSAAIEMGHTGCEAKHAPIKAPERAIQKLQRSYSIFDPLRLLDLVRATMVLPTLNGISDVVDIVHNDPSVKVLRMKNRFADLHAPTGYRNVALVVKLLDSASSKGFLCELQLDLLEFSNEKHRAGSSGHDNYKRYRNLMGD